MIAYYPLQLLCPDGNTSLAIPSPFIEIDLTETQKQLDKTALDLVESQKENLVGRKKLAEQTRGTCKVVYRPTDTSAGVN